jgi:phage baseplate assembly protein W
MILAYPFTISDSGVAIRSDSVRAQIAMLLNTVPGSRLNDPDYGYDVMSIEQEAIGDVFSPERTLFVVLLQEKFARYIPDAMITDVTFEPGLSEGQVTINIFYTVKSSDNKDAYVWQPDTSLP